MSRAAGSNVGHTHEDIDQMSSSEDEEPPPLVESPEERVLATAIVVRQHRGLSVPKMLLLKEGITTMGWLPTSILIVQLLANGTYFLVDGLHRLKAVLDLITVNSLPADYTVPCLVLSADTPANIVKGFFVSANDPHPTPGSAVARVMSGSCHRARLGRTVIIFFPYTRIYIYINLSGKHGYRCALSYRCAFFWPFRALFHPGGRARIRALFFVRMYAFFYP